MLDRQRAGGCDAAVVPLGLSLVVKRSRVDPAQIRSTLGSVRNLILYPRNLLHSLVCAQQKDQSSCASGLVVDTHGRCLYEAFSGLLARQGVRTRRATQGLFLTFFRGCLLWTLIASPVSYNLHACLTRFFFIGDVPFEAVCVLMDVHSVLAHVSGVTLPHGMFRTDVFLVCAPRFFSDLHTLMLNERT